MKCHLSLNGLDIDSHGRSKMCETVSFPGTRQQTLARMSAMLSTTGVARYMWQVGGMEIRERRKSEIGSVSSFGLDLVGRVYVKVGYCGRERETASKETRCLGEGL